MEKLKGKHIAILTDDGFEESELVSPKEALEKAGATVHIIAPKKGKVRGKVGDEWAKEHKVNVVLSDAKVAEYDGLVLPGGVINPDKLRVNKEAIKFVKSFFEKDKMVAAICHGPQVLINAEVVKGRNLTSVEAIELDLKNAGAKWEDKAVINDKGLITSRTPEDLKAFNEEIISYLQD